MMSTMDKGKAVCVSGLGSRTSVGTDAPSTAAAVRAGIAAFAEHPYMIDKTGESMIVARAPYLPEIAREIDRFLDLALPAAEEALSCLNASARETMPIPVIIGLPENRPGLPDALGERFAQRFSKHLLEHCRVSDVETIDAGHSAGLLALEAGVKKILSGAFECCLIGGVDTYLDSETLEWLDGCDQLHSVSNAWGFVPGEAAGFLLLSHPKASDALQLRALARIVGVATARENNSIKTGRVCVGLGLSDALAQVLQALPSRDVKIDEILCDMNGEPYRADEYGFAIARLSERFADPAGFIAPADCWGDIGAASGPQLVGLAITAGLKGYSRGPYALVWTSSEGGARSAAIIQSDIHLEYSKSWASL